MSNRRLLLWAPVLFVTTVASNIIKLTMIPRPEIEGLLERARMLGGYL